MTTENHNETHIEEPFEHLDMKYGDTEAGNRDRFVARNKGKCLYITDIKAWAVWDGMRWKVTDISPIMKLADETAKSIFNEARDCTNSEGVKRLSNWAVRSQSDQKLRAIVNMSSTWPEITARSSEFDQDPDLLNCLNGVVHLPSGELLGHDPLQKIMKLAPVEYQPLANAQPLTNLSKKYSWETMNLFLGCRLLLGIS